MLYRAIIAVCFENHAKKKHKYIVGRTQNFWLLRMLVRKASLKLWKVNWLFLIMATVCLQSWTLEACVQCWYIPIEICVRQCGSGRGFFCTSTSVVLSTSCYQWRMLFSVLILTLNRGIRSQQIATVSEPWKEKHVQIYCWSCGS